MLLIKKLKPPPSLPFPTKMPTCLLSPPLHLLSIPRAVLWELLRTDLPRSALFYTTGDSDTRQRALEKINRAHTPQDRQVGQQSTIGITTTTPTAAAAAATSTAFYFDDATHR